MASMKESLSIIKSGGSDSALEAAELAQAAFVRYVEKKGNLDELNSPADLTEFVQVAAAYAVTRSSTIQMEAQFEAIE